MTATITNFNIHQVRKPAYAIDPVFIERWSPRAFSDKEVPDEVLYSLFEAARWAPSAANRQPWRFILARKREDRERFHSFINEKNRLWCEKAPVIVLVLSKKLKDDGSENAFHAFDAGAAWAQLALQAVKNGLVTHPMGGFDKTKARQVLNIPEEFDIHAVVAVGYQADPGILPEAFQEREKPSGRNPLDTFVFEGQFSQPVENI
jgi:nitroreductase